MEHKEVDRVVKEKSEIISSLEQQLENAQEESEGQIENRMLSLKSKIWIRKSLQKELTVISESFSKIKKHLKNLFIWLLMPVTTVLALYFSSWAQMGVEHPVMGYSTVAWQNNNNNNFIKV